MTWYPVKEDEFSKTFLGVVDEFKEELDAFGQEVNFVTGPGRSGAVAAVYASHHLGIPFIPFKHGVNQTGNLLVIDTVRYTGRTLDQAVAWYEKNSSFEEVFDLFVMEETRGHYYQFWYETKEKVNGRDG